MNEIKSTVVASSRGEEYSSSSTPFVFFLGLFVLFLVLISLPFLTFDLLCLRLSL